MGDVAAAAAAVRSVAFEKRERKREKRNIKRVRPEKDERRLVAVLICGISLLRLSIWTLLLLFPNDKHPLI